MNGLIEELTHALDENNNPKFESSEGLGMSLSALATRKGYALTSVRYHLPFISALPNQGLDISVSHGDRHSSFLINTSTPTRLHDGLNRVENYPDHTIIHVQAGSLLNIQTPDHHKPILINIIT